jgi:hypothetical protein
MWMYWSAFAIVNAFVVGGSLLWALTFLETSEALLVAIVIVYPFWRLCC